MVESTSGRPERALDHSKLRARRSGGECLTKQVQHSTAPRDLVDELRQSHVQGGRDLVENSERGISDAPFDSGDIGPMEAGVLGQVLLRPPLFVPEPLHVPGDAPTNVHARMDRRCSLSGHSR